MSPAVAWAAPLALALGAAIAQAPMVDMQSGLSIALIIVLVGATWKLSASLTTISERLRLLGKVPERLTSVEQHVANLETDVNNLWCAVRGDNELTASRRERGPYPRRQKREDNDAT